jgi:hypothetical protein
MLWIILVTMILTNCTTNTSDFCYIYKPVLHYSELSKTYPQIYTQIKRNNLKFTKICDK